MNEYTGDSAKNYKQGNQRLIIANPGIERMIPPANDKNSTVLDLACGNGHFYPHLIDKGYTYTGVDLSSDLIAQAKERFPAGSFHKSDATTVSSLFKQKFDLILCALLLNVFDSLETIKVVLNQTKALLEPTGQFVVCNVHPCFDPYMQKGLLGRNDVETHFDTYFSSPTRFIVHKQIGDTTFTFDDYHFTFSDFINTASETGFYIEKIDECPPDPTQRHLDLEYYEKKKYFPTFYVMNLKLK